MKGSTSIARQITLAAVAGLICSLLTSAVGCSSAGTAAENAGKAAASQLATSAASTATATVAAPVTVTVSTSPQAIWGRWVRKGPVVELDGSVSNGLFAEVVFRRNGSFMNQRRTGMTSTASMVGSYQILGNVITTKVGTIQQTLTYQVRGSELSLINPKTHQIIVFQRG